MLALVVGLRAWFQCKEGLYNFRNDICITADECDSYNNRHAYKAVGSCLYAEIYGDNQPIKQEDGSYECRDNFYLKFEYKATAYSTNVTCVESKDDCGGFYML